MVVRVLRGDWGHSGHGSCSGPKHQTSAQTQNTELSVLSTLTTEVSFSSSEMSSQLGQCTQRWGGEGWRERDGQEMDGQREEGVGRRGMGFLYPRMRL